MALFKRDEVWHYDFEFQKTRYRGSTFLKNKEKATTFVGKLRADLAMGLAGITRPEPPPVLSVFLNTTFLESVRQNARTVNTRKNYEYAIKRLCEYPPFTMLRLDKIDEPAQQGYKTFRLAQGLSPWTINAPLRVLRKAMIFADVCGLARYKKVRALPGEKGRTYILDGETEKRYLELADYPLREVVILILDLGLRPEEAVSLRKTDVTDDAVTVVDGKSANARRALSHTERTRQVFALCFALHPDSPWVFPGSKGGHYSRGAISNLHTALRKKHNLPVEVIPYACRHTFGTRLAESGANVFEIKEAMGHSSVKVSERYIHPTAGTIQLAMKRKELFDRMLRGEAMPGVADEVPTKTTRPESPTE